MVSEYCAKWYVSVIKVPYWMNWLLRYMKKPREEASGNATKVNVRKKKRRF